jgi:hypothetical protein
MKFDKLYESLAVNEGAGSLFKGLRKFLKGKYMSDVKLDPRYDVSKPRPVRPQPMDQPLMDDDMKKTLGQIKTDTNKSASFSKATDAVLKGKFPVKKGGYTNQSPRSKQTQPGTGLNESFGPLAKWYRKLMQQRKVKKAFGHQAPNRKVQVLPGRNIDRGFKDQLTNVEPKYNPEQRPLDIPHDVPFVGRSKGDVSVNTKIKFGPGKFSKHRTQADVPPERFRKIPHSKTFKESIGKIGRVIQRWVRRTRASGPGTSGPIKPVQKIKPINPKKSDEYRLPITNQIHHKADRLPVKKI